MRKLLLSLLMLACASAFAGEAAVKKGPAKEASTKKGPATEASVRQTFESKLPQSKVKSVTRTPHAGLYEVFVDGSIVYTDENVTFFRTQAQIIDTTTRLNVTEQRMRKLTALNLTEMPPLDMAIKRVKGTGVRQLMVFSDPMCPYCKQLELQLAKLDNITVYLFPYPIESKFPGTTELMRAIWCAPDRAKAWDDWMLRGQRPTAKGTCTNPVDHVEKIGTKLGITVTPTLVFADGAPFAGTLNAGDIDRLVNQTPK